MNAKNIFPKREYRTNDQHPEQNVVCDYLIIYDENNTILCESDCYSAEDWIRLEYNNLIFVAAPGYKSDIFIEWQSLVDFIKKK